MAFVLINPAYREFLEGHGLANPRRLAALAGTVICGHPDRHVQRVSVGSGRGAIQAYLKREHRVPLRQRCGNAISGFGFRSRSVREAQLLNELRDAGIGCPEWIAAVEDDRGRALLLLRGLGDAVDLRTFLRNRREEPLSWRRAFARYLGTALAHLHDSGFDHPDLYAKHVLIDPYEVSVHFLDWQRSRRRDWLPWRHRWRDLAALDATVANHLADERDRLACLFAYLRATIAGPLPHRFRTAACRAIRSGSRRLLRRPQIRELREHTVPIGSQQLIWLDGEALCATPELLARLRNRIPAWLGCPGRSHPRNLPTQRTVPLDGSSTGLLVRRRSTTFLSWLWALLRRRPRSSPELRQAGLLFRLERNGVHAPRLLAFGQRHPAPWRTDSFLLTEAPPDAVPLSEWLAARAGRSLWAIERKRRWHLVRELGRVFRALHASRCFGGDHRPNWPLVVQDAHGPKPTVGIASVAHLTTARRSNRRLALRDLLAFRRSLPVALGTRTDVVRFVRGYLDLPRLGSVGKRLVCRLFALPEAVPTEAPPRPNVLLRLSAALFPRPQVRVTATSPLSSLGRTVR